MWWILVAGREGCAACNLLEFVGRVLVDLELYSRLCGE